MPFDVAAAMKIVRLAEEMALKELGEYVVKEARTRAPVRKLGRERAGRLRKLNKASQYAAIRAAEKYYAKDEFRRRQAVAFIKTYAQERVPRKNVKRQPLRIGTLSERALGGGTYANGKKSIGMEIRARRGTKVSRLYVVKRRFATKKGFELDEVSMGKLSSRGRYEVHSGRAVTTSAIFKTVDEAKVQTGLAIEVGGALKKSIVSSGAESTEHGMKIEITANVPYARYVEFPTSRTAAQPFLLPALKGAKRIAMRTFDGALRYYGLKGGK